MVDGVNINEKKYWAVISLNKIVFNFFLRSSQKKKKTRCPGPELPNNPHKKIYFKITLNVYESFHFIYNESRQPQVSLGQCYVLS